MLINSKITFLLSQVIVVLVVAAPYNYLTNTTCSANALPYPELLGAEILLLTANEVHNYSNIVPEQTEDLSVNATNLSFCNVSVIYTHPGYNDTIHTQTWLPLQPVWNGRFLGTGGGGWVEGEFANSLSAGVAEGYACVSSDAGHSETSTPTWGLVSPGNVNWYLLEDFASKALNDMTVIGKAITASYYGREASKAYWNGCSTGGRQGLMMAQRYPNQYDGILAAAPAINWPRFIVAEYWGQQVANRLGYHPPICELNAITAAAIEACDRLDGLKDNIIAAPGLCNYDARSAISTPYDCGGGQVGTVSAAAATIANAVWTGPTSTSGQHLWYGLNHDAPLIGLVNSTCSTTSSSNCTGSPFEIALDWIRYFVAQNPAFDPTTMTFAQYEAVFHASVQQFTSIIGTADPDLAAFRSAGGKMITWHGLADQLIFPNGTDDYYDRVRALDPHVGDFYRYFQAPGVGHCGGGSGPFPYGAFASLVEWVETGVAPETLLAMSLVSGNGTVRRQGLCPYPLVSAYNGGDLDVAASFECRVSFG